MTAPKNCDVMEGERPIQTDQIKLNSTESDIVRVLEEVERFSAYAGLTGKPAIHVRLLTEETLGMVKAITEDFCAQFWVEGDKAEQRLHLNARTSLLWHSHGSKQLVALLSSGNLHFPFSVRKREI